MFSAKSMFWPQSETELAALAVALGARDVPGWTDAEEALVHGLPAASKVHVAEAVSKIGVGDDPLGNTFCSLRNAIERRSSGANLASPSKSAMAFLMFSSFFVSVMDIPFDCGNSHRSLSTQSFW